MYLNIKGEDVLLIKDFVIERARHDEQRCDSAIK